MGKGAGGESNHRGTESAEAVKAGIFTEANEGNEETRKDKTMADKPMLFSGPMVRALLEGRKTQTRRIVKLPKRKGIEFKFQGAFKDGGVGSPFQSGEYLHVPFRITADGQNAWRENTSERVFSLIEIGARIWVREAFRVPDGYDQLSPKELSPICPVEYIADNKTHEDFNGRYRHGRFMPKWASRITLEVTAVRVERLQDISQEGALAEGVEQLFDPKVNDSWLAVDYYQSLWESIHGEGSWNDNPWVWVYEFKRVKP